MLRIALATLTVCALAPGCGVAVGDGPSQDASIQDACVEGCHWDCFGGMTCWGDGVFILAHAPHPCCQTNDSWPYPGPVCGYTDENPHYECQQGCYGIDPRYSHCDYGDRANQIYYDYYDYDGDASAVEQLLSLPCGESQSKRVGDPCGQEDDCRPVAADDAPRLTCDATAGVCTATARPPAPPGFGEHCGITDWDGTGTYSWETQSAENCEVCHVYAEYGDTCLRQACTVPCVFDEDCPTGTVCVCIRAHYGAPLRICGATTERNDAEDRAAGLTCPP